MDDESKWFLGGFFALIAFVIISIGYATYSTNQQRLECLRANAERPAAEVQILCGRLNG